LKNDGKKRKLLFVMNKATKMAKFGLKMFYSTRGVFIVVVFGLYFKVLFRCFYMKI
jgi:hypothetical protein